MQVSVNFMDIFVTQHSFEVTVQGARTNDFTNDRFAHTRHTAFNEMILYVSTGENRRFDLCILDWTSKYCFIPLFGLRYFYLSDTFNQNL